jgi:hypothetical protein
MGILSRLKRLALPVILFLIFGKNSLAVDLKLETIRAFDQFIASVETRLEPCFEGRQSLWSDELPAVRQQLLNGMVAQPIQYRGMGACH